MRWLRLPRLTAIKFYWHEHPAAENIRKSNKFKIESGSSKEEQKITKISQLDSQPHEGRTIETTEKPTRSIS